MKEYDVRLCVIDALPNTNEALQFAQAFPGKVFLAIYGKGGKDIVTWNDRSRTKETLRKAGPILRFKYTVSMERYKTMDLALGAWSDGNVKTPHERALIQIVRNEKTGRFEPMPICETHLWPQLRNLVRQFRITNEETGEGTMEFVRLSPMDHAAHAFSYVNVALERLKRQTIFTFA